MVAVRSGKDLREVLLLFELEKTFERVFAAACRRLRRLLRHCLIGSVNDAERQVLGGDDSAMQEGHRMFDGVLQFTHITRPAISRQHIGSVLREVGVDLGAGGFSVNYMARKRQNVLRAIMQGRNVDLDDG